MSVWDLVKCRLDKRRGRGSGCQEERELLRSSPWTASLRTTIISFSHQQASFSRSLDILQLYTVHSLRS